MTYQDWLSLFGSQWGYDVLYDLLKATKNPGFLQAKNRYGLSRNEALAIRAYTLGLRDKVSPYEHVNSFLRFQKPDYDYIPHLCADLAAGVDKLPVHVGRVFRATTIPYGVWRKFTIGSPFIDRGFLSSSTEPDAFDGRDILMINSKTGRKIAALSAMPAENEVLFVPNARFIVNRIQRFDEGSIVEMEEVP